MNVVTGQFPKVDITYCRPSSQDGQSEQQVFARVQDSKVTLHWGLCGCIDRYQVQHVPAKAHPHDTFRNCNQ